MAFWNRNKQEVSDLPPEYAQYYQTDSTSRGRRILAAILGVVVGLFVLFLLFLAGRFVYRQAGNRDNEPASPSSQTSDNNAAEESPVNTPPTTSNPSNATSQEAPTTSSSAPTTTSAQSTSTNSTTLPSTGVDE